MVGTVETVEEYAPGKMGVVRRWLDEIQLAGEWQRQWEDDSRNVIRRYEGELQADASSNFNILHSNTETLRPALFGQTPQPDIRRRVQVPAPAERTAAELLERAVRYQNDTQDYENEVNMGISDLLLAGRMTMRVRYIPTIVKRREPLNSVSDEEGNARYFTANMNEVDPSNVVMDGDQAMVELEELQFERVDLEWVPYCDFRHTPAKRWQDVRWVAFRHYFTQEELEQAFGAAAAKRTAVTVQSSQRDVSQADKPQPSIFKKAEVWEIWDKVERKILFVSEGASDAPLAEIEDGPDYYDLREFFPCPEPLRSILTPSSLLPIPEFKIYQDLANELDEITARIRDIIEAVKVAGAYDANLRELGRIMDSNEKLVAVQDWRAYVDKGGLAGMLDFVPIDPQVKAYVALVQQRGILLDTIFQVIGLGDIQRSQSDPRETATAQRLKGQYGAMRLTPRQRGVQRYLRDLMRIQVELIAEKFERNTLALMTGIPINQDTPQSASVLRILRIDALRSFAVDIETDSTIALDQAGQLADLAEIMQGLAQFGAAAEALPNNETRLALLQTVLRKMKLGPQVEMAMEEAMSKPEQPSAQEQQAQAQMQLNQAEIQLKAQEGEREYQLALQELAIKAQELGLKQDQAEADVLMALGQMFGGQNAA